jgi:hypothetical protein
MVDIRAGYQVWVKCFDYLQFLKLHLLSNQSAGGSALVFPDWWENTDGLVVSGETVDTRFDENETELGVLVLSVSLKMLSDGDSLNEMRR